MDIPATWERSVDLILRQRWRLLLILGAVDRGKSTYCHYLSQRLLATGASVALVDADVGQKDIGPPATITLGYPQVSPERVPLVPSAWYFVGAVTPARHLLPVVLGTRQMVERARATYIIVNTTGFVHGLGRILKSYKIDAVQPDAIVAIEQGRELSALLTPYRHYRILRLLPSRHAIAKTPQQRRDARQRAFQAYFAEAKEVVLPWQRLSIQRILLFTGTRIAQPECLYAARTAEGTAAVTARGANFFPEASILPEGFERYLLCGVATRRGHGVGLALLTALDYIRETVTMLTPVPVERLQVLQCGDLYIDPDGHEISQEVPRKW